MVSKAVDAAVWEDQKDIRPPTYDGKCRNLRGFLEKLYGWGRTVMEDIDRVAAEKYIYKRFRFRLPKVLQELYFTAARTARSSPSKMVRNGSATRSGWTPRKSRQQVESHQASA